MANFIYNEDGDPVGFWDGDFIFRLDGSPVGQLNGPSVHRLNGEYVGELYEDMVVDRFSQDLGSIDPAQAPRVAPQPPPPNRGMMSYGFPDAFDQLLS